MVVSSKYLSWPCTKLPSFWRNALALMGISSRADVGSEPCSASFLVCDWPLWSKVVIFETCRTTVKITLCCRLGYCICPEFKKYSNCVYLNNVKSNSPSAVPREAQNRCLWSAFLLSWHFPEDSELKLTVYLLSLGRFDSSAPYIVWALL